MRPNLEKYHAMLDFITELASNHSCFYCAICKYCAACDAGIFLNRNDLIKSKDAEIPESKL